MWFSGIKFMGFYNAVALLKPSEEEGMSSVLNFNSQFLIQVAFHMLATCIIVFGLYKLLYKPVSKMLIARKERVAKNIGDSEKMLADAETTRQELEDRLSHIENERGDILAAAHATAIDRAEQIVDEANKEAELIRRRAENDIEREKAKAADEIRRQIVEVSALLAARYISQTIDKAAQEKLLDEVIEGLGDLSWSA